MTKALGLKALAHYPTQPKALKDLQHLRLEIKAAKTISAIDDIAAKAKAIQFRYKGINEVADEAGRVWCEAEVKLGEERAAIGKAKGTQGQFIGRAKVAPPIDSTPTIEDLGIPKKRLQRAEKLFVMGEDRRAAYITELVAKEKPITPNSMLALQRQKAKQHKRKEVAEAAFSADGPFGTVVIDPPWEVEKIDREERPNQAAFDYPTMNVDQIATFWKRNIISRLQPDVHLFMWTTNKLLPVTFKLIEDIGFRYVLTMVWHKAGGFQPNDLPQYNAEFVVYARQGSPIFIDTKNFFVCFDGERREHSRKPDKFYDTIRRVTGGSRIDVFSREPREGFAQYGNEIGKFNKVA